MVSYWKRKDFVEAKKVQKDGAFQLVMEGEKYPIWGTVRGHLLVPNTIRNTNEAITLEDRIKKWGPFSVLKHECKQIFNEVHRKLEENVSNETIIKEAKEAIDKLPIEHLKYDMMPPERLVPVVREIHRAWTKVARSKRSLKLRDIICFMLQEDDSYRYRVQWMIIWWPLWKRNPIKLLEKGLKMVEIGEVIGDMKRKIKLLRTGLMLGLQDPSIKEQFIEFFKEVNWKKVKITEAERYHLRAKYFKCDLDVIEY